VKNKFDVKVAAERTWFVRLFRRDKGLRTVEAIEKINKHKARAGNIRENLFL
jgi:hypothetical protein